MAATEKDTLWEDRLAQISLLATRPRMAIVSPFVLQEEEEAFAAAIFMRDILHLSPPHVVGISSTTGKYTFIWQWPKNKPDSPFPKKIAAIIDSGLIVFQVWNSRGDLEDRTIAHFWASEQLMPT